MSAPNYPGIKADVAAMAELEAATRTYLDKLRSAIPASERLEAACYPGAVAGSLSEALERSDGTPAAILRDLEALRLGAGALGQWLYFWSIDRDQPLAPQLERNGHEADWQAALCGYVTAQGMDLVAR